VTLGGAQLGVGADRISHRMRVARLIRITADVRTLKKAVFRGGGAGPPEGRQIAHPQAHLGVVLLSRQEDMPVARHHRNRQELGPRSLAMPVFPVSEGSAKRTALFQLLDQWVLRPERGSTPATSFIPPSYTVRSPGLRAETMTMEIMCLQDENAGTRSLRATQAGLSPSTCSMASRFSSTRRRPSSCRARSLSW
jgi:hypothetical protein